MKQHFFGVPFPEEAEAPSSWLPRAAASQGESLRSFAALLGFRYRNDFDGQFISLAPRHIAKICGLPAHVFDLAFHLLEQAYQLKLMRQVLLTHRDKPRFRFCPVCLKTQRTPYLPVHWRFDVWRMCYQHKCMMEDTCPHCDFPIPEPSDMMRVGPKKDVKTFLSQCHHCFKLLWQVKPVFVDSEYAAAITPQDRQRLANGNAFLASLAHEVVRIPGRSPLTPEIGLTLAERQRLLPSSSLMTANGVRRLHRMHVRGPEARRDRAEAIAKWFHAGHQGRFWYTSKDRSDVKTNPVSAGQVLI